jgi:hypothetical protein
MKASRLRNIIDLFTTLLSENAYMRSLWTIDVPCVVKLSNLCSAESDETYKQFK